jgi:AmmeMemoRadiSam system protein B
MPASDVRPPAVAGRFYPGEAHALEREVDRCLGPEPPPEAKFDHAIACVVPHAGYIYSGPVAGAVYRRLPERSRFLLLGPNHFGRGEPLALSPQSDWLTPLGVAPIDRDLSRALHHSFPLLADDAVAHADEHCLEVQLPFLQRRFPPFSFVPLLIGAGHYAALESLGHGVAKAVAGAEDRPLIIASSDMNHYEPDGVTRIKDHEAIERILALDPRGLYDVVHRRDISMCGYAPVVAMLTAARDLGARRATLIKYATSADTSGDPSAVVGYAGIIVD